MKIISGLSLKILQPMRGDASRSTDGSGLGLVVAKSLVELQNGNLGIVEGYSQVLVGKIYIYFSTYKLTVTSLCL